MKSFLLLAIWGAALLAGTRVEAGDVTNLLGTVQAQICEGKITAESAFVNVCAEWRIEWPEAVSGAGEEALGAIRRRMIDDSFGSLAVGATAHVARVYPTPDRALQLVFSRAYSKLEVTPDDESRPLHAFDFTADLALRFADAGYLGYVLKGYENEGGNGCHSYVVARVLSLATGQPLAESEFMTPAGMAAFPKAFFERVTREEKHRRYVIGKEEDAKAALGNFVIEPDGIRWWLPAYSIFAGCEGVQELLMTWQELQPLMKPGKELEFKAIFAKRRQ